MAKTKTAKKATPKKAVKKAAVKKNAAKKSAPKKVAAKKVVSPLFTKATEALCRKACKALKLDFDTIIKHNGIGLLPEDKNAAIANCLLWVVIRWVNKGAFPKMDDRKHWTYHWIKEDINQPSGFGLSDAHSYFNSSNASVASRLWFINSEDERAYQEPLRELYQMAKC